MIRRQPRATLFPYTTLCRSCVCVCVCVSVCVSLYTLSDWRSTSLCVLSPRCVVVRLIFKHCCGTVSGFVYLSVCVCVCVCVWCVCVRCVCVHVCVHVCVCVCHRQEQCSVLMELLKKFQNCRSCLGNTLQRAEHTINEQASYMGRDNLQRLITTVG